MSKNIYMHGQQMMIKGGKPYTGFDDCQVFIGDFWEKSDPGNGVDSRPNQVMLKLTHPETGKEMLVKEYRHMLQPPPHPPTSEVLKDKFMLRGFALPKESDWCWYGKWVIQVQEGNALSSPAWILDPIPGVALDEEESADEELPDIAPPEELKTYSVGCDKDHSHVMSKLPKDCKVVREQNYFMLFKSTRPWDELRELFAGVGVVGVWNEAREASEADVITNPSTLQASVEGGEVVVPAGDGKEEIRVRIGDTNTLVLPETTEEPPVQAPSESEPTDG